MATLPDLTPPTFFPFTAAFAASPRLAIGFRCNRPAGCSIGGHVGPNLNEQFQIRDFVVDIEDAQAPRITGGGVPSEGWRSAGVDAYDLVASDNVGVREFSIRVGDREVVASRQSCYDAASNLSTMPCAGMNTRLVTAVNLTALPEGKHDVVVEARDPSGMLASRTHLLRVDRTAPAAPRELRVSGESAWRSANSFEVSWAAPPTSPEVAPLVGNEYAFCPATNAAYDTRGCVEVSSSFGDGATSDSVATPGEGAWTLRVAHRDAAGNTNPANVASTTPLRFDATPPTGSFEPFDPRDPTRILFRASDAPSGVARVEIEARRDGESAWQALTVEGGGGRYSAVLDDALYQKGSYEVRARVFDFAGNERSITHAPSGTAMKVALPVRAESRLSAGRSTRVRTNKRGKPKYKQVLEARPTVDYGATITITGRITDPAGNPRARVAVDVFERVDAPARPWGALGTVQTTATGAFSFRVSAGASRKLRFNYAGSPTAQPATKEVELRVRAAATITPDRTSLRNGDEVVFRGRVRSGPIPETGKLVTLQALTRRGWTTFGNARARARDGRWSYPYRFTGTTVRSRYTFRVVVPAESGFPYAQGASRTTRVLVNP